MLSASRGPRTWRWLGLMAAVVVATTAVVLPVMGQGGGPPATTPANQGINQLQAQIAELQEGMDTLLAAATPIQPFQISTSCMVDADVGNCSASFDVPEDKLLVIEHITALASEAAAGENYAIRATIQHVDASIAPGVIHNLGSMSESVDTAPFGVQQMLSTSLRLYAGPGTAVIFEARRDQPETGFTTMLFTVSGQLVDP